MGLIYFRLGNYQEAKNYFEEFLNLSGTSRFLRESSQAYRNLAMTLNKLSENESESKNEYLLKALECYENSLICLGLDPSNHVSKPLNREQFISRFNRNKTLIERSNKTELETVLSELNILQKVVFDLFDINQARHWNANLLYQKFVASSRAVANDITDLKDIIEQLISEYEMQNENFFKTFAFAVGNALENLRNINKVINKMEQRTLELQEIRNKIKFLEEKLKKVEVELPSRIYTERTEMISILNEKIKKL